MKGFNNKFKDFPDYILGITNEIWEKRGIETLYDYYSENIPVRSPEALVIGNQNVIDATRATLSEFPDRELLGEDVIWSGSPEEGMLSSHRILSTATHNGNGVFGKATGKRLVYRVIADCHAINNQINDEWLVRDQGSIVKQLGWDPKDYAKDLINSKIKRRESFRPFAPSVLDEFVCHFFETSLLSPFMNHVVKVKKEFINKLNAITHVDGSARIQSVDKKTNRPIYNLLSDFYKLTGCPILINTSFNVRGEPIVESPKDAYRCFMRTEMDILVLQNKILLYKLKCILLINQELT